MSLGVNRWRARGLVAPVMRPGIGTQTPEMAGHLGVVLGLSY